MSVHAPDKERRLLPRWRTLSESIRQGELQFPYKLKEKQITTESATQLNTLVARWLKKPNIDNATELISAGVVVGKNIEVENAAKLLVDSGDSVAPAIVRVSKSLLGESPEQYSQNDSTLTGDEDLTQIYRKISNFKHRVRISPRDAISWVELARLHTVLGQIEPASRCVEIAISLAPENRFVLRVASRFFVHSDAADKGLFIIRKSRAVAEDPWLQAAEISLSEITDASSKYLKKGISSILQNKWTPRHSAELSGAAATMLKAEGNLKKARKLFRLSVRDPNENALAQAEWASIHGWAPQVPYEIWETCVAPEASALHERQALHWEQAIRACVEWNHMEPTSSRPLTLGTFISLVALEDSEKAIFFMEKARQLNPSDQMIVNNLVVAHAYKGDINKASQLSNDLSLSKVAKNSKPIYIATKGLLAYRMNDFEKGRDLYLSAIKDAAEKNLENTKVLAIWHMLREESKLGTPKLEEIVERLSQKFKHVTLLYPEILALKQNIDHSLKKPRDRNLFPKQTPVQEVSAFNDVEI